MFIFLFLVTQTIMMPIAWTLNKARPKIIYIKKEGGYFRTLFYVGYQTLGSRSMTLILTFAMGF